MIKVSIIIPIYKVEKYLEKCLSSCVSQTLQEIEVIAVNDASPDNSDVVMKKYGRLYPEKIINIFLEKNLKQGGARNIGIERARGKYLCFVDGDDYIDNTMCEKLYEKCERENLEIACCNGFRVYGDKKLYWEKIKYFDIMSKVHLQNFTGQCYMIIRKDIIANNDLYYPLHIFHEDCSVVPLWYLKAERVGLLEEALYYQNMHQDSSSSIIEFETTFQIMEAMDNLLYNAEKTGLYETYKDKIDCFILTRIVMVAKRILQVKDVITLAQIMKMEKELQKWSAYDFDDTIVPLFLSEEEYRQANSFMNDFSMYMDNDIKAVHAKIIQHGYSSMKEKIVKLIREESYQDREIVVWGVGEKGLMFISTLKSLGIAYVVGDNNQALWNKEIETGDIVRDIEWIKRNMREPVFWITATKFYQGIVWELKEKIGTSVFIDVFSYFVYGNNYIE